MNNTALRLVFAAIVVAATAYVYVTSGQLPDPVASKFGTDGRATGYMSRDAHRWLMTVLTLAVPLVLYAAQAMLPRLFARFINIPRRDYWLDTPEQREGALDWLERHALICGIVPPFFFASMQWAIIDANARTPPQFNNTFLLAVGGLFVAWVIAAALTLSLHFRRVP